MSEPQSSGALAVEMAGLDVIPESDRKGKTSDLFMPWFAANISVLGISWGSWVLGFGLSLAQAIVVSLVGVTLSFLVCGLIAKESVISTLTVLLGATSAGALSGLFSPLTAYVFLAFTLLYPPCVAAISTVKSELGGRYAVAVFALQVCVAWVVAFLVHAAGLALGLA